MPELQDESFPASCKKLNSGVFHCLQSPLQESYTQLQQARQLLEQRKFDQAQAICEALVRRYPNYVGALHTLGIIYSEQNKNEYALDCLVRAVMLSPRHKSISTALAEIYLRLGANEWRRKRSSEPSLEPPDAKALLMLGDIYQEDCEYELARQSYRQALAIDPDLVAADIGSWLVSQPSRQLCRSRGRFFRG